MDLVVGSPCRSRQRRYQLRVQRGTGAGSSAREDRERLRREGREPLGRRPPPQQKQRLPIPPNPHLHWAVESTVALACYRPCYAAASKLRAVDKTCAIRGFIIFQLAFFVPVPIIDRRPVDQTFLPVFSPPLRCPARRSSHEGYLSSVHAKEQE